jgi:hypothetical protein
MGHHSPLWQILLQLDASVVSLRTLAILILSFIIVIVSIWVKKREKTRMIYRTSPILAKNLSLPRRCSLWYMYIVYLALGIRNQFTRRKWKGMDEHDLPNKGVFFVLLYVIVNIIAECANCLPTANSKFSIDNLFLQNQRLFWLLEFFHMLSTSTILGWEAKSKLLWFLFSHC